MLQSLLSKIRASETKRMECETHQGAASSPSTSNSPVTKKNSIVECPANAHSPIRIHIDMDSSAASSTIPGISRSSEKAPNDAEKQKGECPSSTADAIAPPLFLHLPKHSVIRANLLSPLSFDDLNYAAKSVIKYVDKTNAEQLL